MGFTVNKQEVANNVAGDHLFTQVRLDDADVVADCRVRVTFDPAQASDAIVAVYRDRTAAGEPVGEPINGLSFFLSRFPSPNEVSFRVSGVSAFSVLVRRSGAPGKLTQATFDYQLGSVTNRNLAA